MFRTIAKMRGLQQTIFAIIIGFAVISFWRGVWGLLDELLIPGDILMSLWFSVAIGLAILLATHYVTKTLI